MVYLSDGVKESVRSLCYYPYTIGKHLDKINQILDNIYLAFTHLPDSTYLIKRIIQNVGSIWYFTRNGNTYIERVSWSSALTKFYYVKSNFITFTGQRNISSVHPSQYVVRDEPYFRCDNGFKVVSRNYRGKQLFNFIDISDGFARIVSDIDFMQVKPFSEYKDMTARGYTPDRRCWMVFEDGALEEMNENILMRKDKISLMEQNNNATNKIIHMKNKEVVRLTESQLHDIIAESVEMILTEGKYVNNKPVLDYLYPKLGLQSLFDNGDVDKVVELLTTKDVKNMEKSAKNDEITKLLLTHY